MDRDLYTQSMRIGVSASRNRITYLDLLEHCIKGIFKTIKGGDLMIPTLWLVPAFVAGALVGLLLAARMSGGDQDD